MTDFIPATQSSKETAWLATRYALGELDEAESRQFEERLANDQHARDALVDAVRLLDACGRIKSAAATVAPENKRSHRRHFLTVAAAASVLLLAGVWFVARSPRPGHQTLADRSTTSEAVEIVARWNRVSAPVGDETYLLADDLSQDSPTELLPPDWLLAAVAQDERLAPGSSPFDETPSLLERN